MIYITGGNSRLSYYILKERPEFIPLVRKPYGIKNEVVVSYEEEELRKVLKNAKAVIHTIGKVVGKKEELYKANVESVEKVVNALSKDTKLIYISSISVYGKKVKNGDEKTRINPDTIYAKTKAKGEEIALSHKNSVIIRPGVLYGEKYKEYFKLFSLMRKGFGFVVGDGENRVPFVHAEDVAKAIVKSIAKKGVYVLAGKGIKQIEALRIANKFFNAKIIKIPRLFALGIAKINEKINAFPLFHEEFILSISSDRTFNPKKAVVELGFRERDIRKGIERMVKAFLSTHR